MNNDSAKLVYEGYERKSSEDYEDRQVASIESQDKELKELQLKLNLNVRQYASESRSAHTIGRPVFNQLLSDIEESKINAILTWHPNRLARNAYDAGKLIYLMDEGKLVEIRTTSRIYRNTPSDKFVLGLEFGISKKDSDDKSEVVKRGLKNKLSLGWRPGVAPQGYLNDRATESGHRRILVDQERFPFIQEIFQLKYKGLPVREILKLANEKWKFRTRPKKRSPARPLAISTLYSILKNPFYCGKFLYSGEWYEGNHEKAVEPEIFDQIQIMLGSKGLKARPHTYHFPYTGLIKCGECGGVVTAENKVQVICSKCRFKVAISSKNRDACPKCKTLISDMVKPTILHYTYYHCTKRVHPDCTQKSVEVKELEKQIQDYLESIEISECFMDWVIKKVNSDSQAEISFREEKIKGIRQAQDICKKKLDNLFQLKISPLNTDGSLISDEQFKVQKQALEAELRGMETQLTEIGNRREKIAEEIANKLEFAVYAKGRFESGNIETKREIVSNFGSNLRIMDKKLDFDAPEYFLILKDLKEKVPEISLALEPTEKSVPITKLEAFYASNSILLRG